MSEPVIRRYRREDEDDCFEVCIRTADAGGDARGKFSTDDLMPDLFCWPYLLLDPASAFVVDVDGSVVGYTIAASDTRDFVAKYREQLLPRFATKHPLPPRLVTDEDHMVAMGHHPERLLIPEVDDYPAHLHMDLLPQVQRQGLGRRLFQALIASLAADGIPGVHLTMLTANTGARMFYDRLGFGLLSATDVTTTLGMAIPPGDPQPR